MRLFLRRAGEAKGLLAAASLAALITITIVTGLVTFNSAALEVGKRSVVDAAPVAERTVLISGPVGAEPDYARHDSAVHDVLTDALGGRSFTIAKARYGNGQQLTGKLGGFARSKDDLVFGALGTLEGLEQHAELVDGEWPRPGDDPIQVTLPRRTAGQLGAGVGDLVSVVDRAEGRKGNVRIVGLWQPRDPADPYWQLAPQLAAEAGASTIGPFVLSPSDFSRAFPGIVAATWLATPDLRAADVAQIRDVGRNVETLDRRLSAHVGRADWARVDTRISRLGERLARADSGGRFGLVTPVLLIIVLGAYVLGRLAMLLHEDRRTQTSLLRARGAARSQLTGLAAREALLILLPAILLSPPLAHQALRYAGHDGALSGLHVSRYPSGLAWLVAGTVGACFLLALLSATWRRGGTYVDDLLVLSRPSRRTAIQRVGVDLALVGLAVLAWWQLRYGTGAPYGDVPGLDPVLAAAPVLGMLAGWVVALRALPPTLRLVESLIGRRQWPATLLGAWQAGRRPHAGPVMVLALAVGTSTLAWSMVAVWQGSLNNQVNQQVGADLRLNELSLSPPAARARQIAGIPGVRQALPGWHDEVRIGSRNEPATVVAVDTAAAPAVVRLHDTLAGGSAATLFRGLTEARPPRPPSELPVDVTGLSGAVGTRWVGADEPGASTTELLLIARDGQSYAVPLAATEGDGRRTPFAVDLPRPIARPLRIAGVRVTNSGIAGRYEFELADLRMTRQDGTRAPIDLGGDGWAQAGGEDTVAAVRSTATGFTAALDLPGEEAVAWPPPPTSLTVLPRAASAPVPAAATPAVLRELTLQLGDVAPIMVAGYPLEVKVVSVLDAVPTAGGDAALLVDLPSAAVQFLRGTGELRSSAQWWIATDPDWHAAAAGALGRLADATVSDRIAEARGAHRSPYWLAARAALLIAALGAVAVAVAGLGVEMWAATRRRPAELAILSTLGAPPGLLARMLQVEQALLTIVGLAVGLVVGTGIGAVMAPVVILTPSGRRPTLPPEFDVSWVPTGIICVLLIGLALLFSRVTASMLLRRSANTPVRVRGYR